MENSKNVLNDIESFKKCTQNLVNEINRAGVEWRDEKFRELTKAIQQLSDSEKYKYRYKLLKKLGNRNINETR